MHKYNENSTFNFQTQHTVAYSHVTRYEKNVDSILMKYSSYRTVIYNYTIMQT